MLSRATSNARIARKYVLFCYVQPALATGKTTFDSRWRYHQTLDLTGVFRFRSARVAPLWRRRVLERRLPAGDRGLHGVAKECIDASGVSSQCLDRVHVDARCDGGRLVAERPRDG